MGSSPTFGIYMSFEVLLSRAKKGSPSVPKMGEMVMYDDGINVALRVGDGKTAIKDLPPIYDIYKKVADLEKEIEQLKLILFSCFK